MRMKGGGLNGLRGKQLALTMAFLCAAFLIWIWEQTPFDVPYLQSPESFDTVTPDIEKENSAKVHSSYERRELSKEEDREEGAKLGNKITTKEKQVDVPLPESSVTNLSSKNGYQHKDNTPMSLVEKECNYAKGRWVPDSRRPLYSGFGCKQWLSPMWACRLTQRTDFSYESFRWQPEECQMKEFDRHKVLKRMQDKTIALVGDSLGRQQFQSMMCMLTSGEEDLDVQDIGIEYGLVKAPGAKRPDGWAYRFRRTNTTVLYYWSASLCQLEPLNISDPATKFAMHLDRPATFLQHYLDRFDVLVLNTGHHWNRGKFIANRWEMYVGGMPNTDRKTGEMGNAKNLTIYSVVRWLDSLLPHHPRLKVFFRTISPRHFFNGDWNTGGSCDNTSPLAGGTAVKQEASLDPIVEGAVKGTRAKVLDITALSQLRDEGHISRYSITSAPGVQDCLHWCLPGIPDTWNEVLLSQV